MLVGKGANFLYVLIKDQDKNGDIKIQKERI